MSRARKSAVLVLENGRVFRGRGFGAEGVAVGEAVFNTSMTGYQEILTDPSYAGQIVVMTAAHIGNTGINDADMESARPACTGLAVREASPSVSSWRAQGALDEYLAACGVVGIDGLDTRAVTRALREGGAQRSAIATADVDIHDIHHIRQLLATVAASPAMEGRDLASTVTCAARYSWPRPDAADRGEVWRAPDIGSDIGPGIGPGTAESTDDTPSAEPGQRTDQGTDRRTGRGPWHVVAYDFGIKHNILRCLASLGCRVTVVPAHTSAEQALALAPDGFFLSNGPGDPAAVSHAVAAVRSLLDANKPIFGICLGHQILALALGARTYKLRFGHHGGNHPVKDLATQRVHITAQNHGFAVAADSLPAHVTCTHINLYDQTVEGISVRDRPVFSVQYHPEASPGPHEAQTLFGRFVEAMRHAH